MKRITALKLITALLLALALTAAHAQSLVDITAVRSGKLANSYWVREGWGRDAPVYHVSSSSWQSPRKPQPGTYTVSMFYSERDLVWTMTNRGETYTIYSITACSEAYWLDNFCDE